MDEESFRAALKKQRRSEGTIEQCIRLTGEFAAFLRERREGRCLGDAQPADLEAFVSWKKDERQPVNSHLWAIHRYYEYAANPVMRRLAASMRQKKIAQARGKRRSLRLADVPGLSPGLLQRLAALGVTDMEDVLGTCRTREARATLSAESHIPPDEILQLARLADLTRLVDIKGTRVRLLLEAGIDTAEKVSSYDPAELRSKLMEVNKERHILKRHPTLVETTYWVAQAKTLPLVVEY